MQQVFKKLLLRCELTDDEKANLAGNMAEKTQQLHRIDANAKSAAAQFKAEKEATQSEIDNAARLYRDGYEMLDVECEEVMDYVGGYVRCYRCDTGAMAHERRMSNSERQMRCDQHWQDNPGDGCTCEVVSDAPPKGSVGLIGFDPNQGETIEHDNTAEA